MAFDIKAKRESIKAKVALAGPSNSGKTFGALTLATGLANGGKIGFIDTENDRGKYEADNFEYYHEKLDDITPEGYIAKIKEAEQAGIDVLIIDSISHEWTHIIGEKDRIGGNSFANWAKLTPRHDKFVNCILNSNMHIICTIRAKDKYVLEPNSKGKNSVVKVGLGLEQRDTIEYEFTTVLMMEHKTYKYSSNKDSTKLFNLEGKMLTKEIGEELHYWCEDGINVGEQVIGTKKAVLLINWLKNKKGIAIEDLEKIIDYKYGKTDVQSITKDELENLKEILKESEYDIDNIASEENL